MADTRKTPNIAHWLYPTGGSEYIELHLDDDIMHDVIDVTGVLSTQIPAMASCETDRF